VREAVTAVLADDVTTGHSTLSWRPVTGGQLLRVECPVLTSSASIAVFSDQGHVDYGTRPPCSSSTSAWNNFISARRNLPEIISKLFRRLIAAHEYFPICSVPL